MEEEEEEEEKGREWLNQMKEGLEEPSKVAKQKIDHMLLKFLKQRNGLNISRKAK